MKYTFIISISSLLLLSALIQCGQSEEKEVAKEEKAACEKPKENVNGMSELAELMEKMSADMFSLRDSINKGASLSVLIDPTRYGNIKTANTTKPKEEVITEQYLRYADAFLMAVESFQKCSENDQAKEFNRMITTCKNCHEDVCPGPLERIKHLRVKED